MRFLLYFLFFINIAYAQDLPLHQLKLPPGFSIEIYAKVPNARQMSLGSNDTLFVGSKELGKVYAVTNGGKKVKVIATGLNMPSAVDFKDGALYVAAVDRILKFDDIENHLDTPPKPIVLHGSLPNKAHHGWRFMRFGPDNKMYIAIGAPCNTCISKDPRFNTISRMNEEAKQFEIYAKGIRNSVGFDWDPLTQYLWFTDNGRDLLGDNIPPDEINLLTKANMDFGFPFCYGNNIIDHTYPNHNCKKATPPAFELPAHVAAVGMRFYTGSQFPAAYHQQIFLAEHGSWNRSRKIGYQVMTATLSSDRKHIKQVKPFITGWLHEDQVWGRPTDILTMRDGSLLISDDFAGVIYRVFYKTTKNSLT